MRSFERPSVLLHIGYHKTGTTFLQTGLFGSEAAGFVSPWAQSDLRDWLVLTSDFEWDPLAVREHLESGLETAELVPVMSDERLSGSPHSGGFDSARIAHRLAEVLPDALVLIGIRNQVDAICSVYQQYVRNGGSAPVEKYLRPRQPAEVPQFRLEHWQYHHLIDLYHQLFGSSRVCVVAFEDLQRDSKALFARIQRFAGVASTEFVDEGRRYGSLSGTGIELKRHANRFLFRNSLNPAAPLYMKDLERRFERLDHLWPRALSIRLQARVREIVEHHVAGQFGDSNLRTAGLTGLDLQSLGYEMQTDDG